MSLFQQALRDAAVWSLLLFSPVILYVLWIGLKSLIRRIRRRRQPNVH